MVTGVGDYQRRAIVSVPSESVIGGVSVLFAVLKTRMEARGAKYHVIGKRVDEKSSLGVGLRLLTDWCRWFSLLRTYRPEVAHVNPSLKSKSLVRDGVMVLLAKLCRVNTVSFFHGWSEEFENSLVGRVLFRWGVGRSDTLVVLGDCYRNKLLNLGYKKQIEVIQNPVSQEVLDRFASIEKDFERPAKVLFLSRVIKAKGVHELIDAFARLVVDHPEIELRVAGDGSETEALKTRVEKEEIRNVSFLGFVSGDDKNVELENASILVLPSYTEGIPLSILEGMAAALPVVTTPVGGIPDFFVDEKMGQMVAVRDSNALFEALADLLENPQRAKRISNYNREFAHANLSPDRFVEKLYAIYSGAINR